MKNKLLLFDCYVPNTYFCILNVSHGRKKGNEKMLVDNRKRRRKIKNTYTGIR